MTGGSAKAPQAYRTIGEVARETGLPQHILRYWETRFPTLRPLQRAGRRRYYAPEDIALIRRIDAMLNREGMTIRGAQQRLADRSTREPASDRDADRKAELTVLRAALDAALVADDRPIGR